MLQTVIVAPGIGIPAGTAKRNASRKISLAIRKVRGFYQDAAK
jgi:hypothetical protein